MAKVRPLQFSQVFLNKHISYWYNIPIVLTNIESEAGHSATNYRCVTLGPHTALRLWSLAPVLGATGWCYWQESGRITRSLSGGRRWARGDCWGWHCRPALGSGCILTQDLVYSGARESLRNRCHVPPVNPPGCSPSRCLFTPCCEGLVTHGHYGNCSMRLVRSGR